MPTIHDYELETAAYRITWEQLAPLLEQLVLLNNRPDVTARYQAEIDAQLERLKSYYS